MVGLHSPIEDQPAPDGKQEKEKFLFSEDRATVEDRTNQIRTEFGNSPPEIQEPVVPSPRKCHKLDIRQILEGLVILLTAHQGQLAPRIQAGIPQFLHGSTYKKRMLGLKYQAPRDGPRGIDSARCSPGVHARGMVSHGSKK